MNLIKITTRNRLTNDSLNSILRIRISGISLQNFHEEHIEKCIIYWFNAKNRRESQRKRSLYKKRETKNAKRPYFNISDMPSVSESSSNSDESEDEVFN